MGKDGALGSSGSTASVLKEGDIIAAYIGSLILQGFSLAQYAVKG